MVKMTEPGWTGLCTTWPSRKCPLSDHLEGPFQPKQLCDSVITPNIHTLCISKIKTSKHFIWTQIFFLLKRKGKGLLTAVTKIHPHHLYKCKDVVNTCKKIRGRSVRGKSRMGNVREQEHHPSPWWLTHPCASRVEGGEAPPPCPPGAQPLVPRAHPWGRREGSSSLPLRALLGPASSSAVAGLCFPPLIELEGSN